MDSGKPATDKPSASAKPPPLELNHWWGRIMFGRYPRRTLLRILFLAVGSFVTFKFVLTPIKITGRSMEPTHMDGRINFINRLSYLRHKPQRGDVVGIRTAGEHVLLLKRIIGLPGEQIEIIRGVVFINGRSLEEPYVEYRAKSFSRAWREREKRLDDAQYYVSGDNRAITDCGEVGEKRIVGKVLF